ncbi:MAG: Ldh family oxidoreductase [Candidatus Hadarchaeales archaeon]
MILTAEREKEVIRTLLLRGGAGEEEAEDVAEVLTEGDLRGFHSHGLLRLPYILRALRRGTILPRAEVRVVRETQATALLDGGHGLGHHVAKRAMSLAVEKARKAGIGAVGVFNSNHFGIAGYYAEMAMKEGMVGVVATTTDPLVHPWGGCEPLLGTNALALGLPTRPPILLDMAMSVAARGKLVEAAKKGERIPEGWAVDREGRPTTDPEEGLKGALSPFGGPKGYGLAFVLELLAGPMVNAAAGKKVRGTLEPVEGFCTKGDLMLALDPSAFTDREKFLGEAEEFIREVKSSRRAEGVQEILLPGEPEFRKRERYLREGIPLPNEIWEEVKRTAKELGLWPGEWD